MTAPVELLRELKGLGVGLQARHGNLIVLAPKGVVTPQLSERLKVNKAALLSLVEGKAEPDAGESKPDAEPQRQAARDLLNQRGARIMPINGRFVVGVWASADGPETRAALAALGMDGLEVRQLDNADPEIAEKYREGCGCQPFRGHSVPHDAVGVPFAVWKANELNRLCNELGTGCRSRLTAATVRHGERAERERCRGVESGTGSEDQQS